MLARYAERRSPALRDELIRRYLPLARYCANQYARPGEPFEDLLQVACVGLIKAVDRYDPAHGVAFSSYAFPTMSGELRRHFRDRGWTVRPPRDLQVQALDVERATGELARELGGSPTIADIAARTGLTDEEVLEAREALAGRHGTSLSSPIGAPGDVHTLADVLGADDPGFAKADRRVALGALTQSLTHREREIVRLRFEEDLTQSEIGAIVGLSQMHVSRVLREILAKLRLAATRSRATFGELSG